MGAAWPRYTGPIVICVQLMSTSLEHLLSVLPWQDWTALALFFISWIGYVLFAKRTEIKPKTKNGRTWKSTYVH